jgi:hypothetical membrane protein
VKRLLWAGVVGPLLFIVVFLIEGLTRPGYSQWRNFVSQLSTGETGWVQIVNFLVCGTLVLLFAIGLRAAIRGSNGAIGAPILLGLFAITLLIAGIFSTDPGLGYPPGAKEVQTDAGSIHGFAGLLAFTLLPAAAFVMGWHFRSEHATRWTIYSVAVGALMLVLFVAFATVSGMDESGTWPNAPTGFLQRIAIVTGWTWMAMVAWHHINAVSVRPA